jgi:hypothetical protein
MVVPSPPEFMPLGLHRLYFRDSCTIKKPESPDSDPGSPISARSFYDTASLSANPQFPQGLRYKLRQVFWLVPFSAAFPSSNDSGLLCEKVHRSFGEKTHSDGFASEFNGIPYSLQAEHLNARSFLPAENFLSSNKSHYNLTKNLCCHGKEGGEFLS